MFDPQKYIKNGKADRAKIVSDIQYCSIGLKELEHLMENSVVKAGFFGDGYKKKVPQKQWTERYLDQLAGAVVADCFNPEYLYYLNEVAEYVNSPKEKIKRAVRTVQKNITKGKQKNESIISKLLWMLGVLAKIVLIVLCLVAFIWGAVTVVRLVWRLILSIWRLVLSILNK